MKITMLKTVWLEQADIDAGKLGGASAESIQRGSKRVELSPGPVSVPDAIGTALKKSKVAVRFVADDKEVPEFVAAPVEPKIETTVAPVTADQPNGNKSK